MKTIPILSILAAGVLHRHYKALVSKQDAERYFSIFPKLNSPHHQ